MKKLLSKLLLFLPFSVAVFATTWVVDPANIKNDASYEAGVASILLSGRNVANLVNYEERILQKRFVGGQKATPDVVVLGSSRSMGIASASFPGRTLRNNAVSGASLEDYLGIYDLYLRKNLKPRLVVLGLEPWLVNSNNGQKRWEGLEEEYFEMMSRLGDVAPGGDTWARMKIKAHMVQKYGEFLSPGYFNESLFNLVKKGRDGTRYWATDQVEGEVPIKAADGSYAYGVVMRQKSVEDVNIEARAFALANPIYSLGGFSRLDESRMRLLDGFVRYLENSGVKVVFFLPPYHPAAYGRIRLNPAYAMVPVSENWYRQLAQRHGIPVMGSFDPVPIGLSESDFYDGMHPKNQAVRGLILNSGRL